MTYTAAGVAQDVLISVLVMLFHICSVSVMCDYVFKIKILIL